LSACISEIFKKIAVWREDKNPQVALQVLGFVPIGAPERGWLAGQIWQVM
jgi:hypothetical protein